MPARWFAKLNGHDGAIQTVAKQYGLDVHNIFAYTLNSIWRNGGQRQRLGLAISGGVDSMALARLCSDVVNKDSSVMAPLFAFSDYPRTETSFTAFIVNHRLRENSGVEALRVAEELANLDIEAEILELNWDDYGDPKLLNNVESIARTLRYQALGLACANRKIKQLLLGHHADDQAETVMARIVNNYVGLGLGGMRQTAPIPECNGIYGVDQTDLDQQAVAHGMEWWNSIQMMRGGIVVGRPLLTLRKSQLTQICLQNKVPWFEDHTNTDRALTVRNSIRFLQNDDVLPTALRSPRLLEMADNVGEKRSENERLSERIFADMRLTLDLRSGEARIFLPERPFSDDLAAADVQSRVLRKMIQLVTPNEVISLQDLHLAAGFVFSDCANGDDESDDGEEKYQIAGVSLRRNTNARSGKLEDRKLTLHRALPRVDERRDLQVALWPPPAGTYNQGDVTSLPWRLWDGRYWICVSPPYRDTNSYTAVTARFLDKHDLATVRKHMNTIERKTFDKSLAVAKGDMRFSLPAIVAKERSKLDDEDSEMERIVAIPSLNWSASGWERGFEFLDGNTAWRWDIKFKQVELNWDGPHSVVSN